MITTDIRLYISLLDVQLEVNDTDYTKCWLELFKKNSSIIVLDLCGASNKYYHENSSILFHNKHQVRPCSIYL